MSRYKLRKREYFKIYWNTTLKTKGFKIKIMILRVALFLFVSQSYAQEPYLILNSGHNGIVWSVAYSQDGKYFVSGGSDGIVNVWEGSTFRRLKFLEGHTGSVTKVSFSPNGKYILSGDLKGNIKIWETSTWREIRSMRKFDHGINSASFSPNGKYIITGGTDNKIIIWETATGKEIRLIDGHTAWVSSVCFSPDGRYFASGSWDKSIKIWETVSGREIGALEGHKDHVNSVAFSNVGNNIVSSSTDKTIKIWNIATRTEIRSIVANDVSVNSAHFSSDGKYIVSGGGDIDTGGRDESIKIWETATGKAITTLKGHKDIVESVRFSPEGKYIISGSRDGSIKIWETDSGREIESLEFSISRVGAVSFSPDGKYFVSGHSDNWMKIWETTSGRLIWALKAHNAYISSISFSSDGKYIASGSGDKSIKIWETVSGKEIKKLTGHKDNIIMICFSPNGKYLASGSYDGTIKIWETATGKEIRTIQGHNNYPIWSVSFSPDAKYLISGCSNEGLIKIWETATGKEIRTIHGHRWGATSLTFSPDGKYLASGSAIGWIKVWETSTYMEVTAFRGHRDKILTLSFSFDGNYLMSGSADNTINIWEVATGKTIKSTSIKEHIGLAESISFRNDGKYMIAGGYNGQLLFWDIEKSTNAITIYPISNSENWIAVNSEGRFDANNLEEIPAIHWIVPDEPMRTFPPEIFMRDYYEPQLLPRILSGEKFKSIRPLMDLNRVQPGVKIIDVKKGASPDIVNVTIEVNDSVRSFQRESKDVVMKTGVHDLRLYRNGQIVGQWPEPEQITYKNLNTTSETELNAWRKATEIMLDENGKALKIFAVRLPQRVDLDEVDFTAYAFNLDRVKSETSHLTYKVPAKFTSVKGLAYVINVGVSGNEDMSWRLIAPAQDAKLIQQVLAKNLGDSKKYEKVVLIPLITVPPVSDLDDEETKKERNIFINPTKENIKTVIDLLAGRKVDPSRMESFPTELRNELHQVHPEDLVFLSFSSHGLTDTDGEFYVLPYNLGTGSGGKVTSEILNGSISSQELSLWLSGVDAEQIYMVIDACHSGAAVEVEGFKPGPMGNPGLGQLSYDKGMPILAATQATEVAWAKGYSLLTFALAKEAIEGGKAGTIIEAFKYAEERVPKLYEAMVGKEGSLNIQQPKLFDFKRANFVY